jgi:hypothetical protein
MKWVLSLLVLWAPPEDFCPALAALVGPIKNIFNLTVHCFTSFFPIAQQAGQAVVPRHLSLNMGLWLAPAQN